MKNRAFAATLILAGTFVLTSLTHAEPSLPPKSPKALPFQGVGGRDISESAWQSWQAPVGTVDPERLISSDPTDSTSKGPQQYHFDALKADSLQPAKSFNDEKPIQVEESKPIEKIETVNATEPANPSAPVLATTAPKTDSGSKRVIVIALVSVAVLAYRKFRRASRPYPPKPNFL